MFLVSCISRYFILFVAIVNGSSFLIWLSLHLLLVYRNACDFCTLILYPEILLKLLISFRSFWAEALGFSRYTIMSSANRDNLASKFSEGMLSCASFQRECFHLLPIQYDIGCGFVINSSYYFEICSIKTWFIEFLA